MEGQAVMNARLEELCREAAHTQEEILSERGDLAEVRSRLLAEPSRRHRGLPVLLPLAAAAAVAGVVIGAISLWPSVPDEPSNLTMAAADGEPIRVGQWLAPGRDGPEPLDVRFSDGSTVSLRQGSSGRVEHVEERGARILLEQGRAHVAVLHRPSARWEVAVGPFELVVRGTSFDVGWQPEEELFVLTMDSGAVTVSSSDMDRRLVEGGQFLIVRRSAGETLTRSGDRAPDADPWSPEWQERRAFISPPERPQSPPSEVPPDEEPTEAADSPPAASPAGKAPATTRHRWRDLARAGSYGEAVSAARSEGWERVLSSSTAPDLLVLADAARLAGDRQGAVSICHRVRDRFTSSDHAATAAFHLGRIDHGSSASSAARWFRVYLRERPRGPLAREAQGRLIESLLASGDRPGAQAEAEQYLERHPRGPHAALARRIAASP